jgi:protein-tyrosine phosphatase
LTNEVSAATNESLLGAIALSRGVDPELLRPVLFASPRYLDEAFAAADKEFGGVDRYLRDGLGLDDSDTARLRGRLLEG